MNDILFGPWTYVAEGDYTTRRHRNRLPRRIERRLVRRQRWEFWNPPHVLTVRDMLESGVLQIDGYESSYPARIHREVES